MIPNDEREQDRMDVVRLVLICTQPTNELAGIASC